MANEEQQQQQHQQQHQQQTNQPGQKPAMTAQGSLAGELGKKYLTGAASQAGKKTVDYESENVDQQMDDAKAKAQGMWAKYCGCLA